MCTRVTTYMGIYILCAHTDDDDGDRIGRGVGATKFQNNSIEGLGFRYVHSDHMSMATT